MRVRAKLFARGYRSEMVLLCALQPALALNTGAAQAMFSVYCTGNDVDAG